MTATRSDGDAAPTRDLASRAGPAWLAEQHEGRLGYLSGCGPRSVVVRFAVCGDSVVIRLPEYHQALGYASDRQVCLQVDGASGSARGRTSLEVHGKARRADGERITAGATEALGECWPDGVRTHQLVLPLTEVALRYETGPAEPPVAGTTSAPGPAQPVPT